MLYSKQTGSHLLSSTNRIYSMKKVELALHEGLFDPMSKLVGDILMKIEEIHISISQSRSTVAENSFKRINKSSVNQNFQKHLIQSRRRPSLPGVQVI